LIFAARKRRKDTFSQKHIRRVHYFWLGVFGKRTRQPTHRAGFLLDMALRFWFASLLFASCGSSRSAAGGGILRNVAYIHGLWAR
jgi:hypothetical protein